MTPRILIAPRPKKWGGPGIFLSRVANELARREYRWTAVPFHYTGISILRWDHAFLMGCPRYKDVILGSGKPTVTTMGKPESREEHAAVKREYLPAYENQEEAMAHTIMASGKVVFISDYVKDIWRKIFILRGLPFPPESRVKVIRHGVDTNCFSPPHEPPALPFVLGSVGSLRERFRLTTLFAVSRLLDFDHRILIVGSMTMECREEFEKAMRDPRLSVRITHVPWVDADSLPDYYRRMHCLFHPVDYEGLGIAVAEALACGVPVVVPAHGAPKEFVLPEGGIAVETEHFHYGDDFCWRMADAVGRIRENWMNYSQGARKQAEQYIDLRSTVDAYLDFMVLPRRAGQSNLSLRTI